MQRRSLIDCSALTQVLSTLEFLGAQPASGLKTIIDSAFRRCRYPLNGKWAKEHGADQFDPERIELDSLRNSFIRELVGQDSAKRTVLDQLKKFREFGRKSPAPFLRLLFAGPSGVGKTELAKIICRNVFGSDAPLLLIPCTEYSQAHEVAKLLGAPPGYTGHDQPALLESHRKRFPAGVLLLDEFEKAHDDIKRFFMNILEEGFAVCPRTDAGQPIRLDFTNYTVIATSNAGSREIDVLAQDTGVVPSEVRVQRYEAALKMIFPVELLGRFQARVIFEYLSQQQMATIAEREVATQVAQFEKRCRERSFAVPRVVIQPDLYEWLATRSDRALGARELRRNVESHCQQSWLDFFESNPRPACVQVGTAVNKTDRI